MATGTEIRQQPAAALPVMLAAGRFAAAALVRGAIGLAILIGVGFVSVDAPTEARPGTRLAFSDRFVFAIPAPTSEAVDLTAARRDAAAALARLTAEATARHGGVPARGAARYVTVGQRTGEAMSELVRYRIIDVAGE
jgi:hypothetical protein